MTLEHELEKLRRLQIEERKYVDTIERRGTTGRVVNYLRSRIDLRELKIKVLLAAVSDDSGALRNRSARQIEQQNDTA
jgi:hypothetical protein